MSAPELHSARPQRRALDTVRVLDLSCGLAGPYCTRQMCDLGAEVLKVERPPAGDPTRLYPYVTPSGESGYFMQQNWGKKGLCLDLRAPAAIAIILGLVRVCDVVVEDLPPGQMADHGLGYQDLRRLNPSVIVCSITPYGLVGPYSQRPGTGLTIEAAAGLTELCGHPGQAPYPFGYALGDVTAGSLALGAITMALYHRRRSGQGQHLDISRQDGAFSQHEQCLIEYTTRGLRLTRGGTLRLALAPYGIYRTQDGFVVTAGGFERLCQAMGRPELAQDPRFDSAVHRQAHARDIVAIVADWLATFANSFEAAQVLRDADLTAARLPDSFAEVMNDPQLRERNMFAEVEHPRLGKVRIMNSSFRFSETATGPQSPSPGLGQHNEVILTGLLGYSREQVALLQQNGTLQSAG